MNACSWSLSSFPTTRKTSNWPSLILPSRKEDEELTAKRGMEWNQVCMWNVHLFLVIKEEGRSTDLETTRKRSNEKDLCLVEHEKLSSSFSLPSSVTSERSDVLEHTSRVRIQLTGQTWRRESFFSSFSDWLTGYVYDYFPLAFPCLSVSLF